jgi:serine/threonine protein kinase
MDSPPPNADPSAPRLDDRYRAHALVARGSRSTVWRGADEVLDRPVALKVANADDPEAAERLHDEAAVHRVCAHPSIATMLDADLGATTPFLVLGLAPSTLADEHCGPASATAARSMLGDILDGLLQLQAVGLAHTRLRADHVLAHWGGRVALCGLGDVRPATAAAVAASAREAGRIAFRALTASTPPEDGGEARALLARERPDACGDDPVLIGVIDALLQPDPDLRLPPAAARGLLQEPLPLLLP